MSVAPSIERSRRRLSSCEWLPRKHRLMRGLRSSDGCCSTDFAVLAWILAEQLREQPWTTYLNYQPARLCDIRRLALRLVEGRTVSGHRTSERLRVVETTMP